MDNIILTSQTKSQLVNEIALEVLTGIESLLDEREKSQKEVPQYLTGKEVEHLLGISTQTRYDWGKRGILQA